MRIRNTAFKITGHTGTYVGTEDFLKDWNSGLLILVKFLSPGSGSAFPIRIRIQESKIYADPSGTGSTTLVSRLYKCRMEDKTASER
jgi:hypothetical protein